MINDIEPQKRPPNGKAIAGVILLVVGMMLLIHQFDFFFFPHWLFTWPMWLIFWGLFIGARSNFHKPASFILVALGVIFLFTENLHNSGEVVWPLGIMAFGLWMILRRHNTYDKQKWKDENRHKWDWHTYTGQAQNTPPMSDATYTEVPPQSSTGSTGYRHMGDDYLDAVAVFGGKGL
jgi:hypothetical protein